MSEAPFMANKKIYIANYVYLEGATFIPAEIAGNGQM